VGQFIEKIKAIPLILRISALACAVLGVLQIVSLAFPAVSPNISGHILESVSLILLMGGVHIAAGYGVYLKQSWSFWALAILPIFQYLVLFSEIGFPERGELEGVLIGCGVWFLLWCLYFISPRVRSYYHA
jgi:hypothetical protein